MLHGPVVVTLVLEAVEIVRLRQMLHERVDGEWELAEDLQALGRSLDESAQRVGLCLRIDASLDVATSGAVSAPA